MFDAIEAQYLGCVLADSAQQLSNVGKLMPRKLQHHIRIDSEKEYYRIFDAEAHLEKKFDETYNLASDLLTGQNAFGGFHCEFIKEGIDYRPEDRKSIWLVPGKHKLRDTMDKMHEDRDFLENIIEKTFAELYTEGTFEILKMKISDEFTAIESECDVIANELHLFKECQILCQMIVSNKIEVEKILESRQNQIFNLKDYLQELKSLKTTEARYKKQFADVKVNQTDKQHKAIRQEATDKLERIKYNIIQDNKVHADIEKFLKMKIQERIDQLNYWANKYESETERMQKIVEGFKERRQKDIDRANNIRIYLTEYSHVVNDYNRQKLLEINRQEQAQLELANAIKIQSWWRGIMVRRCYGPYKKKKQKKSKKK